jgi:hypothetical protein
MKIKFFSTRDTDRNIKCTVHITGKLGFSKNSIKYLDIDTSKYVKIGINEEDKNDTSLYLLIQDVRDKESFRINKAGNYYYLNTKFLFDELNIDYKKTKIIYDIQRIENEGLKLYKLNKRTIERKKSHQ